MSLKEIQRFQISVKDCYPLRSLCWQGDELVDWVGGEHYRLDGSVQRKVGGWGLFFDAAVASPDGRYVVIYGRLGTKGLVLKEGKLLREINRSYYRADNYEYPIALFTLPDGRAVIAHCPEEYNKIEIEEVETGKRLTERTNEPQDLFHSRLKASCDGKHILNAGWVWQPWDVLEIYSISEALKRPEHLDGVAGEGTFEGVLGVISACFFDDDTILFTAAEEGNGAIGLYHLKEKTVDWKAALEEPSGTIMPVGKDYLVGFYNHPKLFEIATGKVVLRWPELNSGKQDSSIIHHVEKLPSLALDPERKRFAVAGEKEITVIQLG